MTVAERSSPVQRYALGRDSEGQPRLVYDMQGGVVRFCDHLKALNAERALSKLDLKAAAKARAEAPPVAGPPRTATANQRAQASGKALKAAVKDLRELGWSDGDIVFCGELAPGQLEHMVDLQPALPANPSSTTRGGADA